MGTTQIKTWNFLLKSLIKYELLNQTLTTGSKDIEKQWLSKINQNYHKSNIYLTSVNNNKTITEFKFKNNLFLILMNNQNSLNQINQFKFVKQSSISKTQKLKALINNAEEKKLKPNIYFTTTLKELLKYKEKKKKKKKKKRLNYLKSRSEIINYKDCHEVKDS